MSSPSPTPGEGRRANKLEADGGVERTLRLLVNAEATWERRRGRSGTQRCSGTLLGSTKPIGNAEAFGNAPWNTEVVWERRADHERGSSPRTPQRPGREQLKGSKPMVMRRGGKRP